MSTADGRSSRRFGGRWPGSTRTDPWHRVRIGLWAIGLVFAVGTLGYQALGLSAFDAFYQTSISITTVGYGEVGPEEHVDQGYRTLTLFIVLVGTGSMLYTMGMVVETLLEGTFNDRFRTRRMQRMIDELTGHVIVAGWGRVGHAIAASATRVGRDVVVIDRAPADEAPDVHVVIGEATDDEVLIAAGLERASILIAALDTDADNLYVTLTARSARPDLFVVARTSSQSKELRFFQAGANRVVNPHEIGGSRMAALALQPHVAEFLDEVLHDDSHDVSVVEVVIESGSAAVGRTIDDSMASATDPPVVLAVRKSDGRYVSPPDADLVLDEHDVLIVLGCERSLRDLVAQL